PRHRWQTFALAIVLTAALAALWLAGALALIRGARGTSGPMPVAAFGLAGGAGLFVTLGLVVGLLASARAGDVPFPPPPPLPAAHAAAASLPRVLSASPPRTGLLVTPGTARAIAEAVWPLRDRA